MKRREFLTATMATPLIDQAAAQFPWQLKWSARDCYDEAVDLSPSAALWLWNKCDEFRIGVAWFGNELQLKVDGLWRGVCRTDLMDDVCIGMPIQEAGVRDAKRLAATEFGNCYGVRIGKERWAFITHMTDG